MLYNSHNLTSVICLRTVCSIRPIDRILLGPNTLGQSELESNDNEGVLHIPQLSKAGASPLDWLMSYPGHPLVVGRSYPPAEMQSVYSTASTDRAKSDFISNEEVTPHSSICWSLTIRCSLVSYLGHPFLRGLILL